MGKNAKRRKEAKLQEKLKRAGVGHEHCHHEGCGHQHHEHAAPVNVPVTIPQRLLETTDR
jgi:hypothetical protein